MRSSDTAAETRKAKFVVGAKPLTTLTEEMLIKRAKEIAVINGRNGNEFTPDEYDQARRELAGYSTADATERQGQIQDTGEWPDGAGQKTQVRPAKDEQTFAEDLVKEGVEEATHHTMLAGSEESARRDKI